MKKIFLLITFCSLLFMAGNGQTKLNPVIKDYGTMYDVPFAKDKPDPSMVYKIIIEAAATLEKPEEMYAPLEHISRMYNLHVYSGIPQKNLYVELVIFGPPVAVVLDNDAYKKKFGVDNPNLKIIEEMTKAGIKIHACGQSVVLTGIDPATVNPNIDVVVSRFTTVTDRQMKGYAFLKF
ncbi:MAG TPA: DsrE family protein [Chitinophagaceae bacterium]|jgi:intracellular sulfur oxidation DsrE/DsrF family protein|nr:DsrE family protein [Chitinophagaceae bacterium]